MQNGTEQGQGSLLLEPPSSHWPWQGLFGVICPRPSWLVPSCSFLMCRTTAVALKACCQTHHLVTALPPSTAISSPTPQSPVLTFHLLLAKFFLICSLTDWWMFLSRAVSPAILEWGNQQGGSNPFPFIHPQEECPHPLPGVLQGLLARETLVRVLFHQVSDEVFS